MFGVVGVQQCPWADESRTHLCSVTHPQTATSPSLPGPCLHGKLHGAARYRSKAGRASMAGCRSCCFPACHEQLQAVQVVQCNANHLSCMSRSGKGTTNLPGYRFTLCENSHMASLTINNSNCYNLNKLRGLATTCPELSPWGHWLHHQCPAPLMAAAGPASSACLFSSPAAQEVQAR